MKKVNADFIYLIKKYSNLLNQRKKILKQLFLKGFLKAKYKILEFEVSKWFPMDTVGNKLDLENILKKNKNYFK